MFCPQFQEADSLKFFVTIWGQNLVHYFEIAKGAFKAYVQRLNHLPALLWIPQIYENLESLKNWTRVLWKTVRIQHSEY